MEFQKEIVLRVISPITEAGSAFSLSCPFTTNPLRPMQYNFSPKALILEDCGNKLQVTQLGALERPLISGPVKKFDSILISQSYGPVSASSIFFLAKQLPNLKTFRFMSRKPPTEIHDVSEGIKIEEFSHSGVDSIEILVDLQMYAEASLEKKEIVIQLCIMILRMCGKCFPNVSKLKLLLPEDGPQIYLACAKLIRALPNLHNMVKLVVDFEKCKISCNYPGTAVADQVRAKDSTGNGFCSDGRVPPSLPIDTSDNATYSNGTISEHLTTIQAECPPVMSVATIKSHLQSILTGPTTLTISSSSSTTHPSPSVPIRPFTMPIIPISTVSHNGAQYSYSHEEHHQNQSGGVGKEIGRRAPPTPFKPYPTSSSAGQCRDPRKIKFYVPSQDHQNNGLK